MVVPAEHPKRRLCNVRLWQTCRRPHYNCPPDATNRVICACCYLRPAVSIKMLLLRCSCEGLSPSFSPARLGQIRRTLLHNQRHHLCQGWLDIAKHPQRRLRIISIAFMYYPQGGLLPPISPAIILPLHELSYSCPDHGYTTDLPRRQGPA